MQIQSRDGSSIAVNAELEESHCHPESLRLTEPKTFYLKRWHFPGNICAPLGVLCLLEQYLRRTEGSFVPASLSLQMESSSYSWDLLPTDTLDAVTFYCLYVRTVDTRCWSSERYNFQVCLQWLMCRMDLWVLGSVWMGEHIMQGIHAFTPHLLGL